ncbi:MAG: LysM peptidoglycan-binding domain-containing protein [Pseudomonadota bacterium]|nr:LysM peptidoglycan-binding domain-containing protein [Pseudomonadota bacterium]
MGMNSGAGNGAAQDALKKRMGGGTWTVAAGDTLSRIASRRYGNAALWETIRDSNPDRVQDGGRLIYVGTELDIPEVDVPQPAAGVSGAAGTSGAAAAPPVAVDPIGECPAQLPDARVTAFGTFEVYPDDYEGLLPRSHDGVQMVRQARFLELEIEAETATVNPDIDALAEDMSFATPETVVIAGEQVRVASKAEAQHVAQMFKEIKEVYGIHVDSQAGVDAVKARYDKVPATEIEKLRTKEWEYKEVLALHSALGHFAPLLDTQVNRGVRSVSKVHQSINENEADGHVDRKTMGEYFGNTDNVSIFTAGTESTTDFEDNQTQLEATAIHELAHGLMEKEVTGYWQATGYWKNATTPVKDVRNAEEPLTTYGHTNASEDLSEATMFYFTAPDTLSYSCPLRYAYIDRVVTGWSKQPDAR